MHGPLSPRRRQQYLEGLKVELGGATLDGVSERAVMEGIGWPRPYPAGLFTMIGRRRLDNVQACVESALRDFIPGDLIEAGVWRGGAAILMRGVLAAHGCRDKQVVAADSFAGVPEPRPDVYAQDAGFTLHLNSELAVSESDVRRNFERFYLYDDQVAFVAGRFCDTLPQLADRPWAVIRLDGDLYESTLDGLVHLYPNLTPGGFIIIDDYGAYGACAEAVTDYRDANRIDEPMVQIDWTGVYWQKACATTEGGL